jgi:hypothetical protein
MIKYNIKNLYEDRYAITWQQPMGDGTCIEQVTTFRTTEFLLRKFLTRAQAGISGYVAAMRAKNPRIPRSNGARLYEWDGDVSALPVFYKNQAEKMNTYYKNVDLELPKPAPIPTEPELFEVVKRAGTWTIIKHDSELLTWAEACNELAKRIA